MHLRVERGLTAYGNRQAFTELASWLTWIAKHDPSEHYECHLRWHMESEEVKFDGKRPSNVWVNFESGLAEVFDQEGQIDKNTRQAGFEVTFMAVTEQQLDEMGKAERG